MELLKPNIFQGIPVDVAINDLQTQFAMAKIDTKLLADAATFLRSKIKDNSGEISVWKRHSNHPQYNEATSILFRCATGVSVRMRSVIDANLADLRSKLIGRVQPVLIEPALRLLDARLIGDKYLAELRQKEWNNYAEYPDFDFASDAIYYAVRGGKVWAMKYPVNYMDVYPYVEPETTQSLCDKIKSRDKLAATLGRADLRMGFGCVKFSIMKRVNYAVAKALSNIPPSATNRVTFHFDCRRIIQRVELPPGHIHMFNIFYDIGWQDWLPSATWEETASMISYIHVPNADKKKTLFRTVQLNYRIVRDMAFDVITHIIKDSTGAVDIWISEDRCDSISYMLVSLGSILCTRDVHIVFEDNYETFDQWKMASLAGKHIIGYKSQQPVTVADIHSVIAIYLLHHEIYHKTTEPHKGQPPTYLPLAQFVLPKSPLFLQLLALFRQYHPRWAQRMQVQTDLAEIQRVAAATIRQSTAAQNGEFIVVIAAPGTGKTTYTATKSAEYKVINSDIGKDNIRLNGRYFEELVAEKSAEIATACQNLPGRLREVIATTLEYEHKRVLARPYRIHSGLVEEIVIANRGQTNILYETPGFHTFLRKRTEPNATDCDSEPPPNIDALFEIATEIVLFYNDLRKIYSQQLLRSLSEKRIVRYYREVDYFNNIWLAKVPKEWQSKITVIGLGDSRQMTPLMVRGTIIGTNYAEYLQNNAKKCEPLQKFLAQFGVGA